MILNEMPRIVQMKPMCGRFLNIARAEQISAHLCGFQLYPKDEDCQLKLLWLHVYNQTRFPVVDTFLSAAFTDATRR